MQRILVAAVVSVLLSSWAAAGAAAPAQPIKNIVLVHGAFADGSSWAKVIPILQAKGYNVTAVQNPLTSLADDVAATQRALAQQDGPVILVGHSWAGAVITEAGRDPKVAGLVYVAAFGPDQGEAVGELGKAYPPPPALAAPIVDKQGFMSLPTDAVVKSTRRRGPWTRATQGCHSSPIHGGHDDHADAERFEERRLS